MTNTVVQVEPGKELKYAANFGERAFVPTVNRIWVKAGKTYEKQFAAASGYVVLRDTDLTDPHLWAYAADIDGHRRVIGTVLQKELDAFAAKVAETAEPEHIFVPHVGQRVLITHGIFSGQIGKAIWANKKYSKIIIEGSCNQLGAAPLIRTEHCAPVSKQQFGTVISTYKSQNETAPRRNRRGAFRQKRASTRSA